MDGDDNVSSCAESVDFSIEDGFYDQEQARTDENSHVLSAMYASIGSLLAAVDSARGGRCVVIVADSPDIMRSAAARVMMHPLISSDALCFMLTADALRSTRDRTTFLAAPILAQLDRQAAHSRAVVLFMDLRPGFRHITGICGIGDVDGLFLAASPVQKDPDVVPTSLQITAETTADSVRSTLTSLLLLETSRLEYLSCQNTPLAPEILELLAGSCLVVSSISLVNCGLTDTMLSQLAPLIQTAASLSIAKNTALHLPTFAGFLDSTIETLDITGTAFSLDATNALGRSLPLRLKTLRLSVPSKHAEHLVFHHVTKIASMQEIEVSGRLFVDSFIRNVNFERIPFEPLVFKCIGPAD
jgi:hypothetical protein